VVQLSLGLLFWTGNALGLVGLHELLGTCSCSGSGPWPPPSSSYRCTLHAGMDGRVVVTGS
jgi:hypothetical protein